MTLRVAFRITNPEGWTGGVNYILNICRVLRAHAPQIRPIIFAPEDISQGLAQSILEASGALPIALRDRSRWDEVLAIPGWREQASQKAFRAAAINVVFEATGFYGPRPGFAVVSWLPDFQNRRLPHLFSPVQRLVRDLRYRLILRTRSHVMLSSQDAFRDMTEFYGQRSRSVAVIPFALRTGPMPTFAAGEEARQRLGLPDRFLFLPNQFWIHKNHRVVVEALGRLQPDSRPVIAASGLPHDPRAPGLVDELKARIAELGVGESFRILGLLDYRDILALNARADALVNPSRFEGWSTTVEEAKALGTPLVLSSLPVHREQVADEALYFDPDDPDDCARALAAAAAAPARSPEPLAGLVERGEFAQRRFAGQLSRLFLQAAGRAGEA
ncbi:MAG: glycosyltransferase [Caulobacteraceae bacterium]|nr:glycosyltransferase [Caulobacteraceae bacterium]